MGAPSWHIHVSEREAGRWTTCVWCSALMFARAIHNRSLPATLAYAKRIRDAAGVKPGTPSSGRDAQRGLTALLKWTPKRVTGFDNLWANLPMGACAVALGSMGAFPFGHTLRRFDPGFAGGHAVFIARVDKQDRVWWDNPEAAQNGKYQGEWCSKADLKRFVDALAGADHLVGSPPPPVVVTPPTPPAPPVPAPDPTPFSKADLDAASAAAAAAEAAKVQPAVDAAIQLERARIARLLGLI